MTPAQIEQASRELYNAVGDTNWSSSEIMTLIYKGCLNIYRKCAGLVFGNIFQTTSVAGTGEYALPEYVGSIKRITYNGKKLFPITQRDDDTLTLQDQDTSDTGEPINYYEFDGNVYLRPTPASSGDVIKIFANGEPQPITSSSTLEIPTLCHDAIIDFVASEMSAKDQNFQMANYYRGIFQNDHIPDIRKVLRLRKRGDAFAIVQTEEMHPSNTLGNQ
jgi:hypothetical protein